MERKQKQKVKTVASFLNSKTISIFYFQRKSDLQKLIFYIRIQRSWNIQTVKGFSVSFSLKRLDKLQKAFPGKISRSKWVNKKTSIIKEIKQKDIHSAVSY